MQLSVALLLLAPLLATSALASPPSSRGDRNPSIQQRQARSKDVANRLRRGRQRRQGAASPLPNVPTFTSTVLEATETAEPTTVTITITAPAATETSTPAPVEPVETTLTATATTTDDAIPTETLAPVEESPTSTVTEDVPTITDAPVGTPTTTEAPVDTPTFTLPADQTPTATAIEPASPTEVVVPVELLKNGDFSANRDGWVFSQTGSSYAQQDTIAGYGATNPTTPSDTTAAYFWSYDDYYLSDRAATVATFAQASPATVTPGTPYLLEAKMSSRYTDYDAENRNGNNRCTISVKANDVQIGTAKPCSAEEPCTIPMVNAAENPYRQYAYEFVPAEERVTVAIVVECPAATAEMNNYYYDTLYFFDDVSLKRAVVY